MIITIPGLIDIQTHMRDGEEKAKETWHSGTAAALAGGFTAILAMPNCIPPVIDAASLKKTLAIASEKAVCDFAQLIMGTPGNIRSVVNLATSVPAVKIYRARNYGAIIFDNLRSIARLFNDWPSDKPILVHGDTDQIGALMMQAKIANQAIHICHVSTKEEITLIRDAKERGIKVTCDVTPHHLFLNCDSLDFLPAGYRKVLPSLGTQADKEALWANMDIIDCFSSDHAPHLTFDKEHPMPAPGFPGLETALPLYLTAVHEGMLSFEDVIDRCYINPKRIFNLPDQPDTYADVDADSLFTVDSQKGQSAAKWSPFDGLELYGKVLKVVLRGETVFEDGIVMAKPGSGRNIMPQESLAVLDD